MRCIGERHRNVRIKAGSSKTLPRQIVPVQWCAEKNGNVFGPNNNLPRSVRSEFLQQPAQIRLQLAG